jgi:hypothetical protein
LEQAEVAKVRVAKERTVPERGHALRRVFHEIGRSVMLELWRTVARRDVARSMQFYASIETQPVASPSARRSANRKISPRQR